jgi:hypothetical protein
MRHVISQGHSLFLHHKEATQMEEDNYYSNNIQYTVNEHQDVGLEHLLPIYTQSEL